MSSKFQNMNKTWRHEINRINHLGDPATFAENLGIYFHKTKQMVTWKIFIQIRFSERRYHQDVITIIDLLCTDIHFNSVQNSNTIKIEDGDFWQSNLIINDIMKMSYK